MLNSSLDQDRQVWLLLYHKETWQPNIINSRMPCLGISVRAGGYCDAEGLGKDDVPDGHDDDRESDSAGPESENYIDPLD